MPVLDAHVHVFASWPHGGPVHDAATRGGSGHLLFEMDRAGVERAVLIGAALDGAPDNDAYCAAAVAEHPERLVHFIDAESRWSAGHHRPGGAARLAERLKRCLPAGISHYLAPVNDGFFCDPEGRLLLATARRFGLPVSLSAGPAWFDDVIALCRDFPEVTVLLDHLGLLGLSGERLDEHLGLLAGTAELVNLWVKVSGLHHGPPRPWDYPYPSALELVERIFDLIGPSRMVWGSDFPGVLDALTYRQSLELLREHAGFATAGDLHRMLGADMSELLG